MTTDVKSYVLNHTMLRVRDPELSLAFYRDLFGMTLLRKLDFEEAKFSLYFLAFEYEGNKGQEWSTREGILELTHNWGTEKDDSVKYHNGNVDPRGFGHICFSVDNIQAACDRLEAAGVKFQKKLSDGRQKDIAFALDPDNYWLELISQKVKFPEGSLGEKETQTCNYRFNHTMIRVKDPKPSLHFYQEVLGMSLLRKSDHESAKFTLYFLGYTNGKPTPSTDAGVNPVSDWEGIVELTHNWGTESDPEFKGYHNGNSEPRGFGHLCVSVDDIDAACSRLEKIENVKWQKKLTDGRMKTVAFILDPDNYWVELIAKSSVHDK